MSGRSKYNVALDPDGRVSDGFLFDSCTEKRYYEEVVKPGVADGTIVEWDRQKEYILQEGFVHKGVKVRAITYKADFYIRYSDGRELVVDVKGYAKPEAVLKRKLFWVRYPGIDYVWVSYSKMDGGWIGYEELKEARKKRKREKGA